jgi:non-ribosomal peptide synthetase component E (peptide arylation enzyme)
MILRGGRNISPRTSEEALIKHPSVLEVSVAAMPDPVMGERACAFVVLRRGKHLSLEGMLDFLKAEGIGVFDMPERLEILDELPRSTGGKYQKNKLTEYVTAKLRAEGRIVA